MSVSLSGGTIRVRTVAYQTPFLQIEVDEESGYQFVRVSDSAALLVYVVDCHEVLLITQSRPALISPENPSGTSHELIAGRFDYRVGVKQLLANEAREEAGVRITEDDIILVNGSEALSLSGGVLTELQFLGFAAVDSSQIEQTDRMYGLPEEREKIQREFVPVDELRDATFTSMSTFALVNWFLQTPYAVR